MELVTSLKQRESVMLDSDRLNDLYAQLGQHAAEDVVCRALEEMAARLAHIDKSYRDGDWDDLRKNARGLGAIAEQLGIMILSKVARDVKNSVDAGDPVAIAATISRLMRVGESSLTEVWEMQDM